MSAGTTEIITRAVIRRNGHLLLARQRTRSWSFLPGGYIKPGERAEPVSLEDHLEFHWLPFDQLAGTDVRPGALKNALLATGDDRTPFWHGWNG